MNTFLFTDREHVGFGVQHVLRLFVFVLALSTLAGVVQVAVVHAAEPLVSCGNNITVDVNATAGCPNPANGCICYRGECNACDTQILAMQILKFFVGFTVLMAAILFVNAGVLYVMSPSNPSNVGKAHKIFTNTLIGLIIVLAAWLLIDTVMRYLYAANKDGINWGPWNSFVCRGDAGTHTYCFDKLTRTDFGVALPPYIPPPPGGGGGSGRQCPPGTPAGVDTLMAMGYTQQQANVMACIAMTESSCIARTPPYNMTHPGSNSSACGLFQVTRTTWNAVSPPPPCNAFIPACMQGSCNARVALALVRAHGYRDWTCPNCNSHAQGCIDRYGH